MVFLSELLAISLVLLTVFTTLFFNVSHVVRKLARRHSVCAESIYSLPITYIACFVFLREESAASVATIYLTVVTLNFSYMKLGRWSTKDWVLRILSIVLTLCSFIVYFAFVGLMNVNKAADRLQLYGDAFRNLPAYDEERDMRFYHVICIFFTSLRFFAINVILVSSIFPQKRRILKVKISEKISFSIKLWKLLFICTKIILIWVILRGTGERTPLPSPWCDIDLVLLTPNSLLDMTFGIITGLMAFDIISSLLYNENDEVYDWNEWISSIKTKNEAWKYKILKVLLSSKEDEENADIGEREDEASRETQLVAP